MAGFDRLVREWPDALAVPSLSVAVFRHGVLVYSGCFGLARPETAYQTASVGKHFTAALALLLAARGEGPGLDAPVPPFLPELPAPWSRITLRHLLSHTAGVPDAGYDSLDFARD